MTQKVIIPLQAGEIVLFNRDFFFLFEYRFLEFTSKIEKRKNITAFPPPGIFALPLTSCPSPI